MYTNKCFEYFHSVNGHFKDLEILNLNTKARNLEFKEWPKVQCESQYYPTLTSIQFIYRKKGYTKFEQKLSLHDFLNNDMDIASLEQRHSKQLFQTPLTRARVL